METEPIKTRSRLAIASLICVLAAITIVGVDLTFSILASGVFSATAFVLGIIALFVIAYRKKELKGYTYAITAIILSAASFLLFLLMSPVLRTTKVRAERFVSSTHLYPLGRAIIRYSKDHDGYLPVADQWCDLLIEYDKTLSKDTFKYPPEEYGICNYAFNKNLDGLRLYDIPDDVVLLFESEGDWNLTGTEELLKKTHKNRQHIYVFFTNGTIRAYDARNTINEPLRWKP